MASPRSWCVADANIWIDLLEGGLLGVTGRLSFDCVIPDVIMHELDEATRLRLRAHGVIERGLSSRQVREGVRMARAHPRPSRTDLLALALAKSRHIVLLTGDQSLREAAASEGVEVHGTLWLLDCLVAERVISGEEAAFALGRMIQAGRRLPRNKAGERLIRWRTGPGRGP
jgi:predicted nucleic acid-binding protein